MDIHGERGESYPYVAVLGIMSMMVGTDLKIALALGAIFLVVSVYYFDGSRREDIVLMDLSKSVQVENQRTLSKFLNDPKIQNPTTPALEHRSTVLSPQVNPPVNAPTEPAQLPTAKPEKTAPTATRHDYDEYVVQPGDRLFDIAQRRLGAGNRWQEIYAINKDVLGNDPSRLKPGQILKIPVKPAHD